MDARKTIAGCRLCAGDHPTYKFSATIMDERQIDYFHCDGCGSLQTEEPVWLDQAYSLHLGSLDCGAVQRNLDNAGLCLLVAKMWGLRSALDFGGGDGMLTRLVRDYGINCFVSDKYADPVYAQGFTNPDFDTPDMLFSFEVFEHFAHPAEQLDALFALRPAVLLASTGLYQDQGKDWSYLSLKSGRHVFFYSADAMRTIARKYGYTVQHQGQYILFVRAGVATGWRLPVFRAFARRKLLRLLRGYFLSRHPFGANRDLRRLKGELPLAPAASAS
ncbi:MAG: hypothetical protein B7Z08_06275 [Sphingomonadales bacterium 32-68-7]|nr:MAG: hypothetical protein B7Z33_08190 [Sphingomonadales bacterium 12-68-11]OYX09207.1 MAG: hypothetical protein B7Z08_06275 [Sphingomonadales bacterium 32-68-7]